MNRTLARVAALIIAAAAAATLTAGAANADSSNPTTGDSIRYAWWSDVQHNESANWFDGSNDIDSFTSTRLPSYNARFNQWVGTKDVVAASSTQLVGSSFQTGGYFAECFIYVNGVQVAHDVATGHYAVAVC